jgi:NAD(P)-dependent dehydrogenase (short-subunit alcohol dehydrogenase family)
MAERVDWSFSLKGKVAIVTGGGRGLGQALALGLAASGAAVAVVGRTRPPLDATVEKISAMGGRALAVNADISDLQQIDRIAKEVLSAYSRIDVLVNNAAASAPLKPAEEVTSEEWDAVMRTNLRGTFFLTTRVAREMKTARSGSIINISSITEEVAGPKASIYCASKGGLRQLTRTLAVEWARYGIRVNAVAPGYVRTELTGELQDNRELNDYVTSRTPMRRWAKPEEFVGAVVYLASDASSFQTGQTILVDGGWTAW